MPLAGGVVRADQTGFRLNDEHVGAGASPLLTPTTTARVHLMRTPFHTLRPRRALGTLSLPCEGPGFRPITVRT